MNADVEKIRGLIKKAIKEPVLEEDNTDEIMKCIYQDTDEIKKIGSIPIALRSPEQHDIYKLKPYSNNIRNSSSIINIIEIIVYNGSVLIDIDNALNYLKIESGAFQDAPSGTILIDETTALITFGLKKEWLHKAIKKNVYDMVGQVWRYNTVEFPFYDRTEILMNLPKIIGGFRDYFDEMHLLNRGSGWVENLDKMITKWDQYSRQNESYRNNIFSRGNDGERNPWAVVGNVEKTELQKLGYNVQ